MAAVVMLADLVVASSLADALTLEFNIATALGVPTTAWQPVDPLRTLYTTNAQIVADYSVTVNLIAQGAYAAYAALIVPAPGDPNVDSAGFSTTWMDLRALDQYNITRIQANFAPGLVTVVNATASTFASPYAPGTLHFASPVGTGPTFSNSGTVSIAPNGSTTIAIVADAAFPGTAGNVSTGITLVMVTPLVGVTVSPLAAGIVGTAQEPNSALLLRGQNKLGSLSPNGAPQAYAYVATSLPLLSSLPNSAPSATTPYAVNAAITRAQAVINIGSGVVQVYVADAAGGAPGCAQNPITGVTNTTNPTISTANAHGLSSGQWAVINGVRGATGVNSNITSNPAWQVTVITGNTFSIVLGTAPGAYTGGGTVDGGDLGMADAAIQASTVPNGQLALCQAAQNASVNLVGTVYISGQAGLTAAQATANITSAVQSWLAGLPIGGVNAEYSGIVPFSEVLYQVMGANSGTRSAVLNPIGALGDGSLALTAPQVAVLGSVSISVVFS